MEENTVFNYLYHLDVNKNVEKKDSGSTTLSYLSWTWAWAKIKEKYPNATYKILKFNNNLPYVFDEKTGYMVFTEVTIEGQTHEMWLPVMNSANKAMKDRPYEYTVRSGKKRVEQASMFDVNKAIMRCLVKNLAMFGLGLYIYAGEDLPESESATKKQKEEIKTMIQVAAELSNKSYKTFEGQTLAMFRYQGTIEDIDVQFYKVLKDFLEDGIKKLKEKQEQEKDQDNVQEKE